MQKHEDNLAARINGNALQPLAGASVTVTDDATGLPAALYSDDGVTPLAQPVITGNEGQYAFYAANGEYTLTFSGVRFATFTRKVILADPSDNPYLTQAAAAAPTGAAQVGHRNGTLADSLNRQLFAEQLGAVGNGVFDCTDAILAAVLELRGNAVTIDTGLGTGSVTTHSSGTLMFGRGVFAISPDALDFAQDMGLTLRGQGSRGANNSVRAATTLLIRGTSAGFGIRATGNGARNLRIMDMDICYEDATFTGHLVDHYGIPGATLERAFLGTYGLTGGTRLQTAASLLRTTYDEFLHLTDVVMDGAAKGILFDNSRGIYEFGGSMTTLDNVVFYDFTDTMIVQDATRARRGLQMNNLTMNPITMAGVRGIDVANVQGLTINGGIGIGSVGHAPTIEWMRLLNSTGHVHGFGFGDYSKAGTFGGFLDLSNNVVDTTDGFDLEYGVITGKGNRFRYGASGWKVDAPTGNLALDIGPDHFSSSTTKSYDVSSTSALVSGRINYAKEQDESTSRFTNANEGVSVESCGHKIVSITAATYTISVADSGRTIRATSAGTQQFSPPPPTPGLRFRIETGAANFTFVTSGGYPFYTGSGAVKTSMDKVAADVGGTVECVANGTAGWFVSTTGTWTMV